MHTALHMAWTACSRTVCPWPFPLDPVPVRADRETAGPGIWSPKQDQVVLGTNIIQISPGTDVNGKMIPRVFRNCLLDNVLRAFLGSQRNDYPDLSVLSYLVGDRPVPSTPRLYAPGLSDRRPAGFLSRRAWWCMCRKAFSSSRCKQTR